MIQSDKFDSLFMEIKKILENTLNFLIKRFIEVFGLLILILSILLLIALLSYSPEDPNFIFPDNTKIENILGYRGSFVADLFFQSIGLVSILISITFFFTGSNIIRTKKLLVILQNSFNLVLYSIFGSLFLTIYYPDSFWLPINGNGGFIGKLLSETFLISIININKEISYYLLSIIIVVIFLISINFRISWFINIIKKLILKLFSKKNKTLNNNENINVELENQSPIYSKQVQEDLPFTNNDNEKKVLNLNYLLLIS